MSTFLTPPVWYDETGNKIDILNNKTYTSGGSENTAIGTSAIAGNSSGACFGAVAVGCQAEATASLSIAIGSYDDNLQSVQALGSESIAIGGGAIVNADAMGGIAIGTGAKVNADAMGGIAIGTGAKVVGHGSIAIGKDASVTDSNVIQIGDNNIAYTLNVGNGRMSLKIGSTVESNWVNATSNGISQGLYLVRYREYINTVYLMAPIEVTGTSKFDWYFPFYINPILLNTVPSIVEIVAESYYLKVGKNSTSTNLQITPGYYSKDDESPTMYSFQSLVGGEPVMLFKIL